MRIAELVRTGCSVDRAGPQSDPARSGGRSGHAVRAWRRRDCFADLLGEHEADVLADDVELGDVLHAARAEELDELD